MIDFKTPKIASVVEIYAKICMQSNIILKTQLKSQSIPKYANTGIQELEDLLKVACIWPIFYIAWHAAFIFYANY